MKTLRILAATIIAVALMALIAVPTAQGQIYEKTINFRNTVRYDAVHQYRWYDAWGPDVIKIIEDFHSYGFESDTTTGGLGKLDTLVYGWKTNKNPASTHPDSGHIAIPDSIGGIVLLNPRIHEHYGVELQHRGELFSMDTTGQNVNVYYRADIRFADSTTNSWLFAGLVVADTSTYDTSWNDGIGFWKKDGSTTLNVINKVNNSETVYATSGVVSANTWTTLEFFFDGDSVSFYQDGTLLRMQGSNIPSDEALTPTLAYRRGSECTVRTEVLWCDRIYCIEVKTP